MLPEGDHGHLLAITVFELVAPSLHRLSAYQHATPETLIAERLLRLDVSVSGLVVPVVRIGQEL